MLIQGFSSAPTVSKLSSAAATSMDEATTHIAPSSNGCIAHNGVSYIGADSVVNDHCTCAYQFSTPIKIYMFKCHQRRK
nr:hypothetical protein [Tanacetum cinerariifolium]